LSPGAPGLAKGDITPNKSPGAPGEAFENLVNRFVLGTLTDLE
jgi:hypothetical protein